MPTHPEDRSTADSIRHAVADRYSDIGADPGTETVIPTGRVWAERLGYPADILSDVPQIALQSFTGIGAPLFSAQIRAGERLLDLGCGDGLDSFLAAQAVGPTGQVYGRLFYTFDAADDQLCVDLGGCRIIKKKRKLYDKYTVARNESEINMINIQKICSRTK